MSDFKAIINEVKKAVNGKDRAIVVTLLAMLANGNILIEDIPGVGKTTMAVAFSKALGLSYKRVQFTPDTLPSDITGFVSYNKDSGEMKFNQGPIFCHLFLADELNRTSSRTQAALLEAMEERQVTVEGRSYNLKRPFSVIATQNPVGASGTQLLPDSQVDRFMVKITMGYPDAKAECEMLLNRTEANPLDSIQPVTNSARFERMQDEVKSVFVKKEIAEYIVELILATRKSNLISRGASPRATLALTDMSKAAAYASGRDYVVPQDVQNVFLNTVSHRIVLSSEALSRKMSASQVLKEITSKVKLPRI